MNSEDHQRHDQEAENAIKRTVKEHGWFVALFEADTATPSFAYTIGLWKTFEHPEIIVFGLPTDTMHWMLNDAAELVKAGQAIQLSVDNTDILNNVPVQFRAVDASNIRDYFGYARWFYDYSEFPAIQLIWPDKQAVFPWQKEFNQQYALDQPLLEQKLDFKFFEHRDTATFVARQIFTEGRPILYASHDEEGDWQFTTGDMVTNDDIMIVALDEVVKLDSSVNDLFNMPTGQCASRQFVGDKWVREVRNAEDNE